MTTRAAKKLFRIADEITAVDGQIAQVAAELEAHRHIHDDAVRDAAVSGHYIDREEAGLTAADVARFERSLAALSGRRAVLEERRKTWLARLDTD